MKITKAQAKRCFENGDVVWCYPKMAENDEEIYKKIDGFINPYKPCPIKKYDGTITFDRAVEIAKICVGEKMWFALR